jgi:hypothetical protein
MYRVESIGRVFSNKTREQLEQRLTAEAAEGWYFHSVFSVTETSCAGFQKYSTYYMVLTRVQPPHADPSPRHPPPGAVTSGVPVTPPSH